VKRVFDIMFASAMLVLLSPLLILLSGAVRLCVGRPILFHQWRLGRDGKPFQIVKFRTMTEARDVAGELLPDAQRLTWFGHALRSASLDELPELINVLRGEMSLVGPRPLLMEYRDLYTAEQWRRHEMPPGIAGPVAAAGRNALTWEEKFALDTWYVVHWSLWLDFVILLRTARSAFQREGVSAPGHATMPKFVGSGADQ
jgi:lipopolysaccharide/colanic/teichoic acid biosynthesis glycosyltransferase